MARKVVIPNLDDLLRRYEAGESENKLAREAGVNRWTFRRRLIAAGIDPRGQSEAETAKWNRMSAEQRRQQTAAAHDAVRGRKKSPDVLCRMAKGKQRALSHASQVDMRLADRLAKRGYNVTPQKAIWKYNVDVAIDNPPVAVEIFGGGWHTHGYHKRTFHKRTKYLLDNGWSVLIVWVDGRRYPLDAAGINQVVAFIDEVSSLPAGDSKYRVIWGDGQAAPKTKAYFNDLATIKTLRGG